MTKNPFHEGRWQKAIDVRNFIQKNYTPYLGEANFLTPSTERTLMLWNKVVALMHEEQTKGILSAETACPSEITAYGPAYIDRTQEIIFGLQTDAPLKRAIMPSGGLRIVEKALMAYGYSLDTKTQTVFTKYRKTHNEGVFDVYTESMKKARNSGIITGLPDAYGRGRIIGDYRRVALYGVNRLIQQKEQELKELDISIIDESVIRLREELSEQKKALQELIEMAKSYEIDIREPATTAREAVQWLYLAYLAACKQQDGAAMSVGRITTFLDIYFERDLAAGLLTETDAQEIIDDFVIKLRMIRFLRPPEYNHLFSGDPTWITEAIGGMGIDGRTLVTKTSFRILQTLFNLGTAPEPNLTVLWSQYLPEGFKNFCVNVSVETSAIQYENDDLMRPFYGDDYGIACCVSAMPIGKQMQFFGARANLAKALLYAINGGRDEKTGEQVGPKLLPITGDQLDFNETMDRFDRMLDWLANLYINTLNCIHYMHDKYHYESLQMALHDKEVVRTMACGIAGLSIVVDSLSAIQYGSVRVIRDLTGLAVDYEIEGDYPAFGNNDPRVDELAKDVVERFMNKLRKYKTYRNAIPTQSILTITSNVVYGKKTGATPDGRKAGEPFAPGANPMHGRDKKGAIASFSSVAGLPYQEAMDGISYTFSIVPGALGKDKNIRIRNLKGMLNGYFYQGGQHINVNVFEREMLLDAMEHPEKYPQLTIRVSGYAVNFIKLSREQQLDVIHRTFHEYV